MAIDREREVYERDSSATGILVGVLVVAVVAVLIWLAYSQGILRGGPGVPNTGDSDTLRVNVDTNLPGGTTDTGAGSGTGGGTGTGSGSTGGTD